MSICPGRINRFLIMLFIIIIPRGGLAQENLVHPESDPDYGSIWVLGPDHYVMAGASCWVGEAFGKWPYRDCSIGVNLFKSDRYRSLSESAADTTRRRERALAGSYSLTERSPSSPQFRTMGVALSRLQDSNTQAFYYLASSTAPTIIYRDQNYLLEGFSAYANEALQLAHNSVDQKILNQRIFVSFVAFFILLFLYLSLKKLKQLTPRAKRILQRVARVKMPKIGDKVSESRERKLVRKTAIEETTRILVRQALASADTDEEKAIKIKVNEAVERGDLADAQSLMNVLTKMKSSAE